MSERTFYEFFAGGGMARAGLGQGWRCLFANDFDPKKAASYAENWGGDVLHVEDVANVATHQLPGHADLIWASFPCQDLSLAGNGAGLGGARSGTFWPFWNLVKSLRDEKRKPRTIVLENVCGLLTSHGGADFAALCNAIGDAGYWFGALVIDAQHFVPQSRPRLFLVAVDQSMNIPGHVISPYAVDMWHPHRLRTVQATLPERLRSRWLWFAPPVPKPSATRLIDIIEDEQTGPCWASEADTARLLGMMSPVNRAKIDLVMANRHRSVGAVYKRTRMEAGRKMQRAEVRFDLAGCLRTPGGGSSRQIIMMIENGRVRSRLMSARETARLMGLPDRYKLPERYNDAYHLTGDGVAVPAVRYLAENILLPVLNLREPHIVAA